MADRTGLGVLGLVFGGVTAVVLLIAAFVVTSHVDGRPALDHGQAATYGELRYAVPFAWGYDTLRHTVGRPDTD